MSLCISCAINKNKPVAEITDYGIITKTSTQKGMMDDPSAPGETVRLYSARDMTFLSTTTRIPAKLGLRFGVSYKISNLPKTQYINLTTQILHPPMTGSDGSIKTEAHWSRRVEVRNGFTFGGESYRFDEPFELLPGKWIIILYYEGIKLFEKEFQVYKEKENQ